MVRQRRAHSRLAAFARWSVRRRAVVLEGTLVLAALMAIGSLGLEDRLSSSAFTASGTQSAKADQLLARRFKAAAPDLVLLATGTEPVTSGKAADAGAALTRRVAGYRGVARVESYWNGRSAQLLATDRRSALLAVDLAGDDAEAARTAQRLVPDLARAFPPLRVTATGPTWANVEFIRQGKDDQRRAELVIAPLAVLILLIAFRSAYAALVPAVIGALALVGTLSGLRLLTHAMNVSVFAPNLATALGFGLAVDYSLFIVTRFREELARGANVAAAVERSMAVAGRTVLFSALTVAVAVAGLLVFPVDILRSLAWAAIMVVVLSAASAILVLPALLAALGNRVNTADPFARLRRAPRTPAQVPRPLAAACRTLTVSGAGLLATALLTTLRDRTRAPRRPIRHPRLLARITRKTPLRRLLLRTARTTTPASRTRSSAWARRLITRPALRRTIARRWGGTRRSGSPLFGSAARGFGRVVSGGGRRSGRVVSGRQAAVGGGGVVVGGAGWVVARVLRGRARRRAGEDRLWRAIALAAVRHPVILGGGVAIALVLLAVPFLHARFGIADERILPADAQAHATARQIRRHFTHVPDRDVKIVLPRTKATTDTIDAYARRLAAVPHVTGVRTVTGAYHGKERQAPRKGEAARYQAGDARLLTVSTGVPPQSKAAERVLRDLRGVPAPGPRLLTGRSAQVSDTLTAMGDALPYAAAIIAGATLVLLFLFVGGVLVAVKALVLGALSLGASCGAIVAVFQDGHLRGLVGDFTLTGRLEAMTLLITFTVAFGLSMDYEVFLLSRIKERYAATGDHTAAVVSGIAGTGRLVTAAASVIALSTGFLVTSGNTVLKMNGLGLALAVLMDATVVRGVLVPAFMQVTGKANWWAPAPLARLHQRVGLTETSAPPPGGRLRRALRAFGLS